MKFNRLSPLTIKGKYYYVSIKRDTILEIKENTHGVTSKLTINAIGKYAYDLRAIFDVITEIDSFGCIEGNKSNNLLFLHANAPESKEPLWCPAGMSRDIVIDKFYYVLFLTAKDY